MKDEIKEIKYNGYDWYVIKEDNEKALLFMKNRLSKEEMKELFSDDLLDEYSDVKFSYTYDNWKWSDSPIRHTLNSKWLEKFNKNELVQMETDITFHNERMITKDYVRLLTYEEAEDLPIEVRQVDDEFGYWLASPSYFGSDGANVRRVASAGDLNDSVVYYTRGVRPAVSIKRSTLSTCLTECEPSHEEDKKILEKLDITQEKNTKGNWKWKCEGYNISTPQKIMVDKINEIIDYLKSQGE